MGNLLADILFFILGVVVPLFFIQVGIVTYRFATRSHQSQCIKKSDLTATSIYLVRYTLLLALVADLIVLGLNLILTPELPLLFPLVMCTGLPLATAFGWFALQLFNLRFGYKYNIENDQ